MMAPAPPALPATRSSVLLALLIAVSLEVTVAANGTAGRVLDAVAPSWAWVATAAIPSCLVIAALYARLGDRRALGQPMMVVHRGRAIRLALGWLAIWLAGSVAAAVVTGGWITYARGGPGLLAFLLFGPLGEELLFRGLVWETAWRASGRPVAANALSAMAFSAHHLSLHADPWHGLALAQLAFALPMGLVLARLRQLTGSLWPPLLVHVATNLPASLG